MEPRTHFILYVEDQQRAARFYAGVLGQVPRLDVPGMTEYDLPGGGVLGLMPAAGIRRLLGAELGEDAPVRGEARAELYLHVPDAASCQRRALEQGARELSPMQARDWGHRVAYVRDPDGYILAFAELEP
ncbi:MAG: VOC family protein [Candidatus Eisenbacteria bacterium]